MDPLDAAVLQAAVELGGRLDGNGRNHVAGKLSRSRDEVDVSVANLEKLEFARRGRAITDEPEIVAFGREFLRAVSD